MTADRQHIEPEKLSFASKWDNEESLTIIASRLAPKVGADRQWSQLATTVNVVNVAKPRRPAVVGTSPINTVQLNLARGRPVVKPEDRSPAITVIADIIRCALAEKGNFFTGEAGDICVGARLGDIPYCLTRGPANLIHSLPDDRGSGSTSYLHGIPAKGKVI